MEWSEISQSDLGFRLSRLDFCLTTFILFQHSDAIFSASTASEWCLFFLQLLFYSSLSYDFNHIKKFHCKLTLVDVSNVAVVPQTSTANNNKRSGTVSVVQVQRKSVVVSLVTKTVSACDIGSVNIFMSECLIAIGSNKIIVT